MPHKHDMALTFGAVVSNRKENVKTVFAEKKIKIKTIATAQGEFF